MEGELSVAEKEDEKTLLCEYQQSRGEELETSAEQQFEIALSPTGTRVLALRALEGQQLMVAALPKRQFEGILACLLRFLFYTEDRGYCAHRVRNDFTLC